MFEQAEKESIPYLLRRIMLAQRATAHAALTDLGLHPGQVACLGVLWVQDGVIQAQIGEELGVAAPTVSKMVDRLEEQGVVERRSDPADSRVGRVYLTARGRALRDEVAPIWEALEARVTAGLTVEERLLLRRLLLQIYTNLAAPEAVTAGERPA